jgi:hypothetical protein
MRRVNWIWEGMFSLRVVGGFRVAGWRVCKFFGFKRKEKVF